MPKYRTEDIRNITFVGHSGSGKTSLTEALLVKSGKIGEAGTIERGTTTTDHDPLEKEYQSSLDSALASLDFEGIHVNIIDTPGFPDFRGPTVTGMAATETTALVINAHNGIELSTRRLMRRAKVVSVNMRQQHGVNLSEPRIVRATHGKPGVVEYARAIRVFKHDCPVARTKLAVVTAERCDFHGCRAGALCRHAGQQDDYRKELLH